MDDCRTGWLSPTGEFIPCRTADHISTAREILNNNYGVVPDKELLNRGYVGITILSFFDHGYSIYHRLPLTPEQLQFLKPYYYGEYGLQMCNESKIDFEYELERIV